MTDPRYTLFDQASRNQLGEFHTVAEAVEALARWLSHAPDAADDLWIWDEEEDVRVEVDPATLPSAPAA